MCSELVSDDHAVPFFKYIYKDQKEKRQESTSKSKGIISFLIPFHKEQKEEEGQKPIQWLTPSDFNEDIDIACKIAWQIKPFRPNIYELAERYLCNYLIIWKYLFYEKHIHAMPIEKLFAAVASLNSRKLIHYIINEPGWAYIWLYSDYEDHHNTFLLKMIDPEKEEQAQKISSTICTNIPNFINFYEVINHSIDEYRFSRPMHRRLKLLELNLLKSQPENQLREYYHDHPDFDVFLAILKINLNAITEYNFSENSIFNNTAVLKTLINYHITKEPAQRVLLDELVTFAYDENLIHRVVEKLFKTDQRECLFTFMEFLLENNTAVYNEHIPVLQAIPFFLLSEKLQNQFIKFDNCGQVPYHGLHGTKLIVNKKYKSYIIEQEIYSVNHNSGIIITGLSAIKVRGQRSVILSNRGVGPMQKFPATGVISVQSGNRTFDLAYSDYRITKSRDKWEFGLANFKEEPCCMTEFKNSDCKIVVNKVSGWTFIQWASKETEDKENMSVKFEISPFYRMISKIPDSGVLALPEGYIATHSPSNYHPSLLVSNPKVMSNLKQKLKVAQYAEFVSQLGITSYFHKEMEDVHYGIMLTPYDENCFEIYSLKHQKFIKMMIWHDDLSKYQQERVVVIENDFKVHLIPEEDEYIEKIGYIKSVIVHIDTCKNEGFIFKKDNQNRSDYFFHFRSCNFSPVVGDVVQFLPTLNPSKKHINEPIALKISKITPDLCKILYSGYNNGETHIVGNAIDLITEESLFFRIPLRRFPPIQNTGNLIEEDQVFEYITIEEKEGLPKRIRLIKKIKTE